MGLNHQSRLTDRPQRVAPYLRTRFDCSCRLQTRRSPRRRLIARAAKRATEKFCGFGRGLFEIVNVQNCWTGDRATAFPLGDAQRVARPFVNLAGGPIHRRHHRP